MNIMNIFGTLKEGLTIVSIVVAISAALWGNEQRKEADIQRNNLHSRTTQWTDEKGRLVTETTELRFTIADLKAVNEKDSALLSKSQKELLVAKKNILEMGIKLNNVQSYFSGQMSVSNDSLVSNIVKDTTGAVIALKPIKTDNLSLTFNVVGDSIIVDHLYTANLVTVVNAKEDKLTQHGKKRFILARWISPRYDYWATTRSDDPNASFKTIVYFSFKDKKY